jgi:GSH-dependent disulfide-bond oxidoreductase
MHIKYAIDRYAMEVKRQLDVLDRHLADHQFLAGSEYSIADMATWPWYGKITVNQSYPDAGTFLEGHNYKNVLRWFEEIGARPAVQRGVMVNRVSGDLAGQLHERHDVSDFETKTADKFSAAAE